MSENTQKIPKEKKPFRLPELIESPDRRLSSKRLIAIFFAIMAAVVALVTENIGLTIIFAGGALGQNITGIFERRVEYPSGE